MSKVMRTHTGITEWNGDYWCDSCKRRIPQVKTVDGMDFCPKCYQETFGNNDKDKRITDLEAKLAEKERDFALLMLSKNEEINEWIAVRDDKNKVIDRQTDKINQLKQQLAEKEKEVHELVEKQLETFKDMKEWKWHATVGANQDKIELLERLKSMIKADYDNHFPDFPLGIVEKKHIEYLDTLIKEIKGE